MFISRFLVLFILFSCIETHAQNSFINGIVLDKTTGTPLEFVSIYIKGSNKSLYSDTRGKFSFIKSTSDSVIVLSCVGYFKTEYRINDFPGSEIIIKLIPEEYTLSEFIVKPGKYWVDIIMEKVADQRHVHDMENKNSFSYTAYHRFFVNFKTDRPITEKDTEFTKGFGDTLLNKMYLFLNESVTEKKFRKPGMNKETVIANRVSGLSNSKFSVLGTQLNSFSFYQDRVKLLGNQYLSPIINNNTHYYRYVMEDSIFIEGRKTYIIGFKPASNNVSGMNGLLYIDAHSSGIIKILSNARQIDNKNNIQVVHRYIWNHDSMLIPAEFTAEFDMNQISLSADPKSDIKFNLRAYSRTVFHNLLIDLKVSKKEFNEFDLEYDKNLTRKKSDSILNAYRIEPLTSIDSFTFKLIDSISKETGFEKKLNRLSVLATGKIPLGYIDADIFRIIRVNNYEGLRLGLGLSTSEKLSSNFILSGYYGYGFKDKGHKYGSQLTVILQHKKMLNINASHNNDVFESGNSELFLHKQDNLEKIRGYQVGLMDRRNNNSIWMERRFLRSIKGRLGTSIINSKMKDPYTFSEDNINDFNLHTIDISMRWAFREKLMPFFNANLPQPSSYPVFNIQYIQGIATKYGDFVFNKIDFRYNQTINIRPFSKLNICTEAGFINGSLAYPFLYTGNAAFGGKKLGLASIHSFEVMRMNEFLSDRYGALYLYYDFGKEFPFLRKIGSNLIIRQSFFSGTLTNSKEHKNINYKTAENIYMESGLQLNNLLKSAPGSGIGIGFYYRYGYYSLPTVKENIAIKLTITSIY